LLPGFQTELTGLNNEEALALLTAGSRRGEQVFGLGSALASAMRKVVDALPERHQATARDAAQRFLIDPETDLLSRRLVTEEVPTTTMIEVRRAVLTGHKLRIHYAATSQTAQWRTVEGAMLGAPDFGTRIGRTTVGLGVAGLAAATTLLVQDSAIAAVGLFALIGFHLILGRKTLKLARTPHPRMVTAA
jgi:hypothetical protein